MVASASSSAKCHCHDGAHTLVWAHVWESQARELDRDGGCLGLALTRRG